MAFNKGDIVEVISNYNRKGCRHISLLPIGALGSVVDSDDVHTFVDTYACCPTENFKLVSHTRTVSPIKIGDKVRFDRGHHSGYVEAVVVEITSNTIFTKPADGNGTKTRCDHVDGRCMTVIKPNEQKPKKSFMKTLSLMMKKILDADAQTLVKAGFLNGDLLLTEEGKDALLTMLFDKFKPDLVKEAEAVIAEEEKKSKA